MQHTPWSASTKAPASSENSFPLPSRTAAHVKPADVVPIPVVKTLRGQIAAANRRNWDFPCGSQQQKGTHGKCKPKKGNL